MSRKKIHYDEHEETPEQKELRIKTNLQQFNAAEAGFVVRDGVVYRPNGKPAALCPLCNQPGTVVRVMGVYRQHRCMGYESLLGCGHAFWTIAWKKSRGPSQE